ncbi:MAG: primosomal replication protein N [Arsenophonus endosymbiont of Ceratovacuna japonica]
MNSNKLVLTGKICHIPIRKISPSGVPHCQLVIEHNSQQLEVNFYRKVWCRINIIASGQKLQQFTRNIIINNIIIVTGFISSYNNANGLSNLVLHAKKIELIDSGD